MNFFAASDGTQLHERVWTAAQPVGAIALVHGYGEHIARYDHVAQALNQAGWTVRGCDLRGHGQSGGARGFIRRFDEYVDDLRLLVERTSAQSSGPLFLLSHSVGAAIAAMYLLRQSAAPPIAGWVTSSPFFRLALPVSAAKRLTARIASRVYPRLALPSGLRGADVTRDPALCAEYDRDPLNVKNATVRWFTEMMSTQKELLARAPEIRVPSLFLVAGADKIADPRGAEDVFARLGAADKTLKLYPGQYHELFNEPMADRQQTLADLCAWLAAHAQTKAAGIQ